MKPPLPPPPFAELTARHSGELQAILKWANNPLPHGKYLHWDKVRHLKPPDSLTNEQWWLGIKLARKIQYRQTPLQDPQGQPFVYTLPDPVLARLHAVDHRTGGRIEAPATAITPENSDRYILNSLIEEAINSSQLEGASTTRQVAAEMIREGRRPRDKHEQMIFNNFIAMRSIQKVRAKPLSIESILELHRQLTEDTLQNPDAAGRFQTPDEDRVTVMDNTSGRVAYIPPPASQIQKRMIPLVDFANAKGESDSTFTHPLIRAIVLHFWMAYEHPFEDGNGRVARALFYWAMLHHGYWLFEFMSISHGIKKAPSKYARAFLETETDDNDLTYFIINQLDTIDTALAALDTYLDRKSREITEAEQTLRVRGDINYRQLALLSHALRHPGHRYTIRSHKTSHDIAYATARDDLLKLAERNLVDRYVKGNTYVFEAPRDLADRMKEAA